MFLWENVVYDQYCYFNDQKSMIKLPFFQLGLSEIQSITQWTHITSSTFVISLSPYSSCLDWLSVVEGNIFMYVITLCFIMHSYALIYALIFLFRPYQDTKESLHCYHLQKHYNGKCYNKTSAIPKTKKMYSMRNEYWSSRHALACINVQFLNSIFQSGGNNAETFHANSYVFICFNMFRYIHLIHPYVY